MCRHQATAKLLPLASPDDSRNYLFSQNESLMVNDAIIKQLETNNNVNKLLNIHFKQRNTISGLFIRANDYDSLKSKNLWRIVTKANVDEWRRTKDIGLSRIFNGIDFTRLSEGDQ